MGSNSPAQNVPTPRPCPGVAKRSHGTGRLFAVVDRGARASWYGSWWAGRTRYLRRHLAPFLRDRSMDRLKPAQIERYLHAKRADGLSPKTVENHLNFLHGIFASACGVRGRVSGAVLRAVPDDAMGRPMTLESSFH
jgi:hypothetical protein